MERLAGTSTLILLLCLCTEISYGQRNAQGGLTVEYVYGRMRSLERKLSRTQQEVTKTQTLIKSLEGRIGQGGGGGGASAGAVAGQKFSDLGNCPIRANGFYFAPQFRSCYRLEPSDMLVNQTEATRICRRLSPRSELVSIETSDEQDFLRKRWEEERGVGSLVRFWTSARRDAGQWNWENSKTGKNKPLSFSNWIPTTEHSDDRFSCMAVYSNEAYTWIDVACWAPHLVTCEVNL